MLPALRALNPRFRCDKIVMYTVKIIKLFRSYIR